VPIANGELTEDQLSHLLSDLKRLDHGQVLAAIVPGPQHLGSGRYGG
jgi:hypothetical protein